MSNNKDLFRSALNEELKRLIDHQEWYFQFKSMYAPIYLTDLDVIKEGEANRTLKRLADIEEEKLKRASKKMKQDVENLLRGTSPNP